MMNPHIKNAFIVTLVFAASVLFFRSDYYADLTEKPERVRVKKLTEEDHRQFIRSYLAEARTYETALRLDLHPGERRRNELALAFARIKYLELSQVITLEEAFRRRQDAEQAARLGMTITHGPEIILEGY